MATNLLYFSFVTFAALTADERYMNRCLQLASLGQGTVAPNPMVGAVLVHQGRIIGEGYHKSYGGPHAEVNCIDNVKTADQNLIPQSTLYVSLEPCAHFGKTPPCADLIVRSGIKNVIVAAEDPFPKVNGRGFDILKEAGINVSSGVLERQAKQLNKTFFSFHKNRRPYVSLKWAQTADGFIASKDFGKLSISHPLTNRWVHKQRSNVQAIMIGTNTALHDDPSLTTRLWTGNNPLRIVIDKELKLPASSKLFSTDARLLVLNQIKDAAVGHVRHLKLCPGDDFLQRLMEHLYNENVQSLVVEGGSTLLQSFIEAGVWDEAIIITNTKMHNSDGITAVRPPHGVLQHEFTLATDHIRVYQNPAA